MTHNKNNKKLPIGIQSFSKLIEGDFLYVDKTKEIHQLITSGEGYYFLSRPRRFGKSLTLSALKEIFSGNKELFRGLWIYDKIQWTSHPVIHLDIISISYNTSDVLAQSLSNLLIKIGERNNIKLKSGYYKEQFGELIEKLHTSSNKKVVVLIDEYDKPIIDFIRDSERARANRDVLKSFYEVLKASDEHLRFVFITGVSKFSKVSIFSGLNNLKDITLEERFASLMGYTHEELLKYFGGRIKKDRLSDVKRWYNGYSWDGETFLYNPLSILLYVDGGKFGNYWFATGTPTFLIEAVKGHQIDIKEFENYETNKFLFESFDIDNLNVFSLLFQTGYLTIKGIEDVSPTMSIYRLSYPNEEVKESFLQYLAADLTGKYADEFGMMVYKLKGSVENADVKQFISILKSIFAAVPYDIFMKEKEAYYHTVVYLVLKLLGIHINAEVEFSEGRADAVIETSNHIFVIEFKMGVATEAIAQIKEKKYHQKYLHSSKSVKLLGVGFDPEQRNIGDFKVEDIT